MWQRLQDVIGGLDAKRKNAVISLNSLLNRFFHIIIWNRNTLAENQIHTGSLAPLS